MKKILLICLICLTTLSLFAQRRIAVMEFKAGVNLYQDDVTGLSAIFVTAFQPTGYTLVERSQINMALRELHFQQSSLTEEQMLEVGHFLGASKIVVGDISMIMGQYNVDVRVLNVESGTIDVKAGSEFQTSAYRKSMTALAEELAAKLSAKTAKNTGASSSNQGKPYIIYDYLKVFPEDLGRFNSSPSTVIANINQKAQYGYNTWRLPTRAELALIAEQGIIETSSGYMASDGSQSGRVRLVTDRETARVLAQQNAAAAAQARGEQYAYLQQIREEGYVDLGLPSGTWWKSRNENGTYKYDDAISRFGNKLPNKRQYNELMKSCTWTWNGNGFTITGPNGNTIFFSTEGQLNGHQGGFYMSSTLEEGNVVSWVCYPKERKGFLNFLNKYSSLSVRLVRIP